VKKLIQKKSPRNHKTTGKGIPFVGVYHISDELFNTTIQILRRRGRKRQEGLVLWSGIIAQDWLKAYVLNCIVPRRGHWGGGVTLNHKTLLAISNSLNEKKHVLLAQIHTHPGDFGQSLGDDCTPVIHRLGFISIVVPKFALDATLELSDCYIHEYLGSHFWRVFDKSEIVERFRFSQTVIRV
jgi:hypothetical protein